MPYLVVSFHAHTCAFQELLYTVRQITTDHDATTNEVHRLQAEISRMQSEVGSTTRERDRAIENLQALQQKHDRTLTIGGAKDKLIALQKMKIDILTLDPGSESQPRMRGHGIGSGGTADSSSVRHLDVTDVPQKADMEHSVATGGHSAEKSISHPDVCNGTANIVAHGGSGGSDGANATRQYDVCCLHCRSTVCEGGDSACDIASVARPNRACATQHNCHAATPTGAPTGTSCAQCPQLHHASTKCAANETACKHAPCRSCPRCLVPNKCAAQGGWALEEHHRGCHGDNGQCRTSTAPWVHCTVGQCTCMCTTVPTQTCAMCVGTCCPGDGTPHPRVPHAHWSARQRVRLGVPDAYPAGSRR